MPTKPPVKAGATPASSSTDRLLKYALAIVCIALIGATYNAIETTKWFNARPEIRETELKSTRASDNVFRIFTDNGGGTGYLIQDWRFGIVLMTNKHICDSRPEQGLFLLDQDGVQYLSTVRRIAALTDLCLLETPHELLTKYGGLSLAQDAYRPNKNESLYVFGHPGLRKLTASHGPFVNESWIPGIYEGHIEAKTMKVGRADIVIYPGSSGSPVLNDRGEVIGTIFAFEGRNHIALYVPLREMVEFLSGGM